MDKKILADKVSNINYIIYSFLPEDDRYRELICDAASYSVKAGGKRLRPMIMQETYRMFAEGAPESELLHAFMAAIEFIHTYSLVHDDLPAMDNDMYRRGQLTTHAKYGEAFGILAGDALLNLAYETIAAALMKAKDEQELSRGVKAFSVLARKAGIYGMIGGQVLDVYSEKTKGFKSRMDEIEFIYENKTGALLEASIMAGALLAGASDKDVDQLVIIAKNVGYAFQIRDDILDVTSSLEVLGKPIGSDAQNDKATYVTYAGLDESQKAVERFTNEALSAFNEFDNKNEFLGELFIYLINREN
ncbi:MAG: polyprenyl synthetase family protein [Lachnospiraceae bacterium]|nr:polyprenyl synthetase family protein [Lachnospiraceae bacterium]